jgi:hypothetical protein
VLVHAGTCGRFLIGLKGLPLIVPLLQPGVGLSGKSQQFETLFSDRRNDLHRVCERENG